MPANDTAGTIYDSTPWISGINEQNDTLITHQYADMNNFTWHLGPLKTDGTFDTLYSEAFNYVWKISMDEINTHVAYFQSLINGTNSTLFPNGYTIPADFLTWPAHGDVSLGYDYYLAPFHDYNSDGVYNPIDGDYPTICGDQCLYFVTNDVGAGSLNKMGMQVETWVYAFNTPGNTALQNTFFTKYKFTNQSSHTYHDTRFSQMNDLDIGYMSNDFAATDIAYGAVYAYNASTPENMGSAQFGNAGYGDRNPIESVMLLAGPHLDNDFVDNPLYPNALAQNLGSYADQGLGFGDGIVDNERAGLALSTQYNSTNHPIIGQPTGSIEQFYNLMVGKHKNGSDVLNTLTSNTAPYWAPGNSDVSHERIPASENFTNTDVSYLPSDIRVLATTQPFTFEAGTHDYVDLAFVFALPSPISSLTPEALNVQYMAEVRHFFHDQLIDCQVIGTPVGLESLQATSSLSVYPIPTNNELNVLVNESLIGQPLRLFNSVGELVFSNTILTTQSVISVESFAAGTYVLSLGTERRLVTVE